MSELTKIKSRLAAATPEDIAWLVKRVEMVERLVDDAMTAGAGHHHWDSTMRHGAGCPLCISRHEANERIRAALEAGDGTT
jgi:hypothetical protein